MKEEDMYVCCCRSLSSLSLIEHMGGWAAANAAARLVGYNYY
jgi:hypothetical protein